MCHNLFYAGSMQNELIRILKERREEVHRRIVELRAELAIQEGRADELEQIWKEAIAGKPPSRRATTFISPPRIAVAKNKKSSVPDLILEAMADFEEVGFDGAERGAILENVRKKAPRIKGNTIRVSFLRLVEAGRIERFGNLFRLRKDGGEERG